MCSIHIIWATSIVDLDISQLLPCLLDRFVLVVRLVVIMLSVIVLVFRIHPRSAVLLLGLDGSRLERTILVDILLEVQTESDCQVQVTRLAVPENVSKRV